MPPRPATSPPSAPRAARPAKPQEDRHFVTALARGLDLLACFGDGETTLSNVELAQRCALPKSTVTRLTMTLTRLGYLLHVVETGRYRLGPACLALGSALLTRLDVRRVAFPLMQTLAESTRATVSLGLRDRLTMIYVENCRSQAPLALSLDVGSRLPLAQSAIGRAWLAAVPEAQRREAVAELRAQTATGWRAVVKGITQAVADQRALGVACSFGDWQPEVNAIARAFDPGHGLPLMALNVGGPAFSLTRERLLQDIRPQLLETVMQIEQLLRR